MPVYTYKCEKGHETSLNRTVAQRDVELECECTLPMVRQFAKVTNPTVLERVDQYRNVKQRYNNAQRIRARAKKYFLDNEMPELIAKHGVDNAKKSGWVKKDGKIVKSEDLK